ncbi:MAG: 4-hydroxy-tetrahydrodipicolinate reductase [Clostridium sp.]
MIKVCLLGIGRTGQQIANVLLEQQNIKLVGAICSPLSSKIGMDLGTLLSKSTLGIKIYSVDDLEEVIFTLKPDVVIDFSNYEATMKCAKVFSKMKVNMVIGTTGFSEDNIKELHTLSQKYHNGIVFAPNITVGVNTMMLLANIAASILNNYDFQIIETHHKHKKDSPSGTAIKLGKEIEKALGNDSIDFKKTPITSLRVGGVIGKHEVLIVGEDDKIEISHESFSRKVFAMGAVKAVNFIHKKSGYFEMSNVLNLNQVLSDYINDSNDIVL